MSTYQGDFSDIDTVAPEEKKMWGVHTVTIIGHWLEEHAIAIGSILMLIAIVAMSSDAMTNNGILGRNSKAPFIVAIITAVAAESSGRALLRRCKTAWATNKLGSIVYGAFGVAIVAVIFQTVWMWTLMMTEGVSEAQALTNIGIPANVWTFERAFVFAMLFALHAFIGYKPPTARKKTASEQEREMHEEIRLAPLKGRLAQERAKLAATVANAGKNAVRQAWSGKGLEPDIVVERVVNLDGGNDDPDPEPEPTPTGPRGGGRSRSSRRSEVIDLSPYGGEGAMTGSLNGMSNATALTTLRRRDAAAVNWMLENGRRPTREELRQHFIENDIPAPTTPVTYDNIINRAEMHLPVIQATPVSRAG